MPGTIRQITPDRLQIVQGGGSLALFGLPFFLAGVFMFFAVSGVVPVSHTARTPWFAAPALLVMATAFTGVGGTLVFGRSWTTIDVAQRKILKELGLLVPFRSQDFPLDTYSGVHLGFVRGDSDTADRFPVALKSRTGGHLALCSFTVYAEARECAALVAHHVNLDLEDASSDHPITLSPAQSGEPFRDSAWKLRTAERATSRPLEIRSDIVQEADAVRIVIPKPHIHPLVFALGLLPLAIPLAFAAPLGMFFRRTRTPDAAAWSVLGFLAFFFGVLPGMSAVNGWLRSRRGRTIVLASRAGLAVQERGAWRTTLVAVIPAEDIFDVDYSTKESASASARREADAAALSAYPSSTAQVGARTERLLTVLARFAQGHGIVVKTRQGLTTFGQGLDDEEIRYLYAVILRTLQG